MALLRMAYRHARAEAAPLLALLVLVLATSVLAAVVPLHLSATADTAVRQTLAQATDAERELTLGSANDGSVAQLDAVHEQVLESMPPALRAVTDDGYRGVSSDQYVARLPEGSLLREKPASWVRLRGQPGLLDGATATWQQGDAGSGPVERTRLGGRRVVLFDAAVAQEVAARLGLRVGQTLVLEPVEASTRPTQTAALRISGIFTTDEGALPEWQVAPELLTPGQQIIGETIVAYTGTVLVPESQQAALAKVSPLLTFDWHYPVRAEAVDAQTAPGVRDGLQRLILRGIDLPGDSNPRSVLGSVPSIAISSELVDLLEGYLGGRSTAEAVTSVSVVGVLALAFLVLALGSAGLARRRASALGLGRARGVSAPQALGWSLVEAAVLAVPAGVAGYLIATWAVPARFSPTAVGLSALVVCWALASVVVGTWRTYSPARPGRVSTRALAELVVVLLAVAGLAQLRRRGIGEGGTDPVLATVPLIAVGGAVVLALRLLPHLVRLAGRLTRRRRGLTGFLGLTGAGRVPGSVVAAFSALAVGLGFGAFAAGTQTTVDRGQTRAAWETVGADYRVDAASFLEEDVRRLRAVAGVETVLPGLDVPPSQVIAPTGEYTRTGLLAIDASAYADTLDSAPAGLVDSEALVRIGATPSSDEPLPVLATPDVVTAMQGRTGTLAPGNALPSGPIEVVGEIESFPVAGGGPVVVADLDTLRAQVAPALVRPNMLLLRGSDDAADELRAVAEAFPQATQVSVRATRLADVREDPFVAATRQVFVGGSVVAGGYCALAVVLALLLGGRARAGTRSTLRMLGASARSTSRISILELAPLAALMVATGALVGYLLPWAVLPAIELATFTGGTRPPEVRGDAVAALLSGAGALAVVGLALVIANTTRRRADPSAVPGWGEEE